MPEQKLVVNSDLTFRTTDGHIRLLSTSDGLELSVNRWAVLKQLVKHNRISFRDFLRLRKLTKLLNQNLHFYVQESKTITFGQDTFKIVNGTKALKGLFIIWFS